MKKAKYKLAQHTNISLRVTERALYKRSPQHLLLSSNFALSESVGHCFLSVCVAPYNIQFRRRNTQTNDNYFPIPNKKRRVSAFSKLCVIWFCGTVLRPICNLISKLSSVVVLLFPISSKGRKTFRRALSTNYTLLPIFQPPPRLIQVVNFRMIFRLRWWQFFGGRLHPDFLQQE